jgi:hypothetical protein
MLFDVMGRTGHGLDAIRAAFRDHPLPAQLVADAQLMHDRPLGSLLYGHLDNSANDPVFLASMTHVTWNLADFATHMHDENASLWYLLLRHIRKLRPFPNGLNLLHALRTTLPSKWQAPFDWSMLVQCVENYQRAVWEEYTERVRARFESVHWDQWLRRFYNDLVLRHRSDVCQGYLLHACSDELFSTVFDHPGDPEDGPQ